MRSKRELAVELSKLQDFENPSIALEQYSTPSEIAADWLWQAMMLGDIGNRVILDAGCGPGILGIGSLLLGAKTVYFLDKSESSIRIAEENVARIKDKVTGKAIFLHQDIDLFDETVNIVLQNPPFGTKVRHRDKKFLESAFKSANIVYSMHKWSTKKFVESIVKDYDFSIEHVWRYEFPIKAQFKHHKKPKVRVDVGLWRMVKK